MVTGAPPFSGETLAALFAAITGRQFRPPSALVAGSPPELDLWFARAFAHKVDDRFATARELSATFWQIDVAAAPLAAGGAAERTWLLPGMVPPTAPGLPVATPLGAAAPASWLAAADRTGVGGGGARPVGSALPVGRRAAGLRSRGDARSRG